MLDGGAPVRCKRINFLANRFQCAFDGNKPQTNSNGLTVTCDPRWVPGGSQNLEIVREYCSFDENFFNDPRCFSFCTQNNCSDLVSTNCRGTNLISSACQSFCFSKQTNYDCSIELQNFCAIPDNQSLDVCGCFLPNSVYEAYYEELFRDQVGDSSAIIREITSLPFCSYVPCSAGIFKPRGDLTCPDQAVCVNQIVFNAEGEITFNGDVNLQLKCQQLLQTNSNASFSPPPPDDDDSFPIWLIIVIVISIAIVLFLVTIPFWISKPYTEKKIIL